MRGTNSSGLTSFLGYAFLLLGTSAGLLLIGTVLSVASPNDARADTNWYMIATMVILTCASIFWLRNGYLMISSKPSCPGLTGTTIMLVLGAAALVSGLRVSMDLPIVVAGIVFAASGLVALRLRTRAV